MSVRIARGEELRKNHDIVTREWQRKELESRIKEVVPNIYKGDLDHYLRERRAFLVHKIRGPVFDCYEAIRKEYPDVCLAVVDVVESLHKIETSQIELDMCPIKHFLIGAGLFHLKVRFLSPDPEAALSKIKKEVQKIVTAYGRRVMRKLHLDISVTPVPPYVSPRSQLKALKTEQENTLEVMRRFDV